MVIFKKLLSGDSQCSTGPC